MGILYHKSTALGGRSDAQRHQNYLGQVVRKKASLINKAISKELCYWLVRHAGSMDAIGAKTDGQ
jgi:hypothetical protein